MLLVELVLLRAGDLQGTAGQDHVMEIQPRFKLSLRICMSLIPVTPALAIASTRPGGVGAIHAAY